MIQRQNDDVIITTSSNDYNNTSEDDISRVGIRVGGRRSNIYDANEPRFEEFLCDDNESSKSFTTTPIGMTTIISQHDSHFSTAGTSNSITIPPSEYYTDQTIEPSSSKNMMSTKNTISNNSQHESSKFSSSESTLFDPDKYMERIDTAIETSTKSRRELRKIIFNATTTGTRRSKSPCSGIIIMY